MSSLVPTIFELAERSSASGSAYGSHTDETLQQEESVPLITISRRRDRVGVGGHVVPKKKRSKQQHPLSDHDQHSPPAASGDEDFSAYKSTRERVIRSEMERAGAELAGRVTGTPKEKTGYQLYHMHRVAEIKDENGVKHHEAFKRAAKDWSKLPESEQAWYNNRADKKPVAKAPRMAGLADAQLMGLTDSVLCDRISQVDYHGTPPADQHQQQEQRQQPEPQPPRVTVRVAVPKNLLMMPAATPPAVVPQTLPPSPMRVVSMPALLSPLPIPAYDTPLPAPDAALQGGRSEWMCSGCGLGDVGTLGGLCLMCTAFGPSAL